MRDLKIQSLSCDKTFFELMRRIESIKFEHGSVETMQNRIPSGIRLIQPASFQFSSSEISKVCFNKGHDGDQEILEILIEHKNFGLFAPYGPLPIHITDHAWVEKRFENNQAFEQFINILSSNIAWLHYKAWVAMHPVLCFDRDVKPFVSRLNNLIQIESKSVTLQQCSVSACRSANLGIYLNVQRPLLAMQNILSAHFHTNFIVVPRRGRWHPNNQVSPYSYNLGRWRLGSRIWDVQQTIDIEIGPVEGDNFHIWQRRSKRIKATDAVVRDYTQGRVDFAIHVLVKTKPELAIKTGLGNLGVNSWLTPRENIKRITVHEVFEDFT